MPRGERTRRRVKKMSRVRSRDLPVTGETEPHKVYLWRLRCLKEAGLDADAAKRVAGSDFDLHMALDMLVNGCSPELLLEIVL